MDVELIGVPYTSMAAPGGRRPQVRRRASIAVYNPDRDHGTEGTERLIAFAAGLVAAASDRLPDPVG